MDDKISELQTTNDDLQSMQLTVRSFQETLGEISGRYDRLEKKQEIIDQVSSEVDKTFDNLKDIERRLTDVTRQANNLPDTISDIQGKIDFITNNTGKINDAVDKISSLQNLLEETEKRAETVRNSREGIGNSETRLMNLSKEIDDKIDMLERISASELEKSPSGSSSSKNDRLSPKDKETIIALKRRGWSVEEIARNMKRSEGEIELVLEMGG